VEALHLLDPTLLLDKNDYIQLVEHDSEHVHRSNGNLFAYILDRTTEKQQTVNRIASDLHLTPFEIMPESISTPHNSGESDKMDWNSLNRTISGKRKEAIRFLADNLK
jgi:hypothetical protein